MEKKDIYVLGDFCFVQHPCGQPGHWMRTERCVAFIGCSSCGAEKGVPCLGFGGVGRSGVHLVRKQAYARARGESLLNVKQKIYKIVEAFEGDDSE